MMEEYNENLKYRFSSYNGDVICVFATQYFNHASLSFSWFQRKYVIQIYVDTIFRLYITFLFFVTL